MTHNPAELYLTIVELLSETTAYTVSEVYQKLCAAGWSKEDAERSEWLLEHAESDKPRPQEGEDEEASRNVEGLCEYSVRRRDGTAVGQYRRTARGTGWAISERLRVEAAKTAPKPKKQGGLF